MTWVVLALVTVAMLGGVILLLSRSDERDAAQQPASTTHTTDSTAPAEPGLVARFSGTGNQETGEFSAGPNWEMRWERSGGAPFAVELLTRNGVSRGQIVQAGSRDQGTTFVVEPGEFRLRVTAGGDWTIQIISLGGGR